MYELILFMIIYTNVDLIAFLAYVYVEDCMYGVTECISHLIGSSHNYMSIHIFTFNFSSHASLNFMCF